MTIDLRCTNVDVDPPPRVERRLYVIVFLFRVMIVMGLKVVVVMGVVMMGVVMIVVLVQVVAIHIHAAVEVAIRLPHHRARDVLFGVAEQNGQEVAPRKRLRHAGGSRPREQAHKQRENRQQAVWKQSFHRRLRVRRKRAASNRTAE